MNYKNKIEKIGKSVVTNKKTKFQKFKNDGFSFTSFVENFTESIIV